MRSKYGESMTENLRPFSNFNYIARICVWAYPIPDDQHLFPISEGTETLSGLPLSPGNP